METLSAPRLDCAVAARIHEGESVSGDRHLILPFAGGTLLSVVDGLGHGSAAAESAIIATRTLERHAGEDAASLVLRCHESLLASRGVAVSLATIHAPGRMAWLGVGNVEGMLVRATSEDGQRYRPLLRLPGIVGARLPAHLEADQVSLKRGDTLVLVTDGIRGDFSFNLQINGPTQRLADRILECFASDADDALVLVARYLEADS